MPGSLVALDHIVNIDEQDNNGDTLLHKACDDGFYPKLRYAIDRGANLEVKNAIRLTPLQTILQRYLPIKLSIEFSPFMFDPFDFNPFDFRNAEALLIAGASQFNMLGESMLEAAAKRDVIGFVELLWKYLTPEQKIEYGQKALIGVCHSSSRHLESLSSVRFLLENGVNPNIVLDSGNSLFYEVCIKGMASIAEMFLQSGVSIAESGFSVQGGRSIAYIACQNVDESIIRLLCRYPEGRDMITNETNLIQAAVEGLHKQVIDILCDEFPTVVDAIRENRMNLSISADDAHRRHLRGVDENYITIIDRENPQISIDELVRNHRNGQIVRVCDNPMWQFYRTKAEDLIVFLWNL